MRPTTAMSIAKSFGRDRQTDAAQARFAAQARRPSSDEVPQTHWGIRLQHLGVRLRRRSAAGAATA